MEMNCIVNGNFEKGYLFPWISEHAKVIAYDNGLGQYCALLPSNFNSRIYQNIPTLSFNKYKLIFCLSSDSVKPIPSLEVAIQYNDIEGKKIDVLNLVTISSSKLIKPNKWTIFEKEILAAKFNVISLLLEFKLVGQRLSTSNVLIGDVKLISTI